MSNSPEEMLKSILNDPESINKIGSLLSSLGGEDKGEPEQKNEGEEGTTPFPINPETLMRITGMYNKILKEDDPRVNLLYALLPYMNEKRKSNTEQAIKLLRMSKMSSLLGELNIL